MYKKLFGESVEEQEAVITRKLLISIPFIIGSFFYPLCLFIPLYIWGWLGIKFVGGFSGVAGLFDFNLAIVVVILVAAVVFGGFVGIFIFCIGIIRLIQIKLMKKNK